jgi:hypothetical protein
VAARVASDGVGTIDVAQFFYHKPVFSSSILQAKKQNREDDLAKLTLNL